MRQPTRVGLIGCGFFAQNHLNAWRDLATAGADLVAVCDADRSKAEAAAKAFGVRGVYTDADEMFACEKLGLADIVTRMDTHTALVGLAIKHRVPTIVQKPFAPVWSECVAMVEAAHKAGVFLAVHENFRFQTPMIKVAEAIASGVIGTPSWARFAWRTGFDVYRTQPYFYNEERLAILDVGIHVLDLARVFMGEVKHISCETQRRNPKVRAEDTATMMLRHVSGAVSLVECTYEARTLPDHFPETTLTIEGPRGAIVVPPGLVMHVTSDGVTTAHDIGAPLLPWTSKPWHVAQESVVKTCAHLLACVREGRQADVSGVDNLKTFALVEAAYAAAASGTAVAPVEWRAP
jgi:D-apiose dehydrogenase